MNDIFTMVKRFMKEGKTEKEAIEEVERRTRATISQFLKDKIHEDVNYATSN